MNTKALRQKIVDLAIHGKLLPAETVAELKKSPDYEPADVLLEKIRKEKEEKIAKGELKADKKDSFIFTSDRELSNGKLGEQSKGLRHKRRYEQFADGTTKDIEDEVPFDVPEGWAWCRLNELADIARGGSPRPIDSYITDSKDGINWIKIGDTSPESKYIISAKEKIKTEGKKHSRFVHAGDFLLTNSMSFGRPYILKIDGCIHDGWLVFADIRKCIIKDFLYYALSSDYIYSSFSLVAAGSTVKNLKSDTVKQVLFPLPPLAEQKLIVTEIERIFEQIDALEQNKTDLQAAVKQAKSKILDLAIHGKLVPQDVNDEPTSVLLEKLRAEKEEQIAKGGLKRSKNDSYIYRGSDNRHYQRFADGREEDVSDEIPFKLPDSWSWCKLGELCLKIKRGKSPKYIEKSCVMAFAQKCNQKDNSTSLKKALYIDESTVKKYPEDEKMQFNDVVINSTGTGTLGRVGIFNCKIPEGITAVYPDSHVTTVRFRSNLNKHYCYYFVKTKQLYLETKGEGSTNQKELKPDTISGLYIPLPPLGEQQRIVAKIKELFTLLDRIQSDIS